MSPSTTSACRPRSAMPSAVCSRSSTRRALIATSQPKSASPQAMARPIPWPDPVTTATRSVMSNASRSPIREKLTQRLVSRTWPRRRRPSAVCATPHARSRSRSADGARILKVRGDRTTRSSAATRASRAASSPTSTTTPTGCGRRCAAPRQGFEPVDSTTGARRDRGPDRRHRRAPRAPGRRQLHRNRGVPELDRGPGRPRPGTPGSAPRRSTPRSPSTSPHTGPPGCAWGPGRPGWDNFTDADVSLAVGYNPLVSQLRARRRAAGHQPLRGAAPGTGEGTAADRGRPPADRAGRGGRRLAPGPARGGPDPSRGDDPPHPGRGSARPGVLRPVRRRRGCPGPGSRAVHRRARRRSGRRARRRRRRRRRAVRRRAPGVGGDRDRSQHGTALDAHRAPRPLAQRDLRAGAPARRPARERRVPHPGRHAPWPASCRRPPPPPAPPTAWAGCRACRARC